MATDTFSVMTPKILIAKYTADILRMEPRNVGVIVWSPEQIVWRFLGEYTNGQIKPPSIVPKEGSHAYKEWVTYWRIVLTRASIRDRAGQVVYSSSPDFVKAIVAKSKPGFLITQTGFMRESVPIDDLQVLADECFEMLVAPSEGEAAREHKMALHKAATRAMSLANLGDAGELRRRFLVECTINRGVKKPLPFDFAVVQGDFPLAIFQKVALQNASICSASFMFEKLKNSRKRVLKNAKRCALIMSDITKIANPDEDNNLEIVQQYAHVIDVADPDSAADQIRRFTLAA